MLWLLWACAGGGGAGLECETVYQLAGTDEVGETASGYEYCAAADDGRGAFNRVSAATCDPGFVGECSTDADCDADELCVCGSAQPFDGGGGFLKLTTFSQCVAATCAGADDCDGNPCGVTLGVCGDPVGHYCRAGGDACSTDADCPANSRCSHDGNAWSCVERADCE
jgi:hypothetical protein